MKIKHITYSTFWKGEMGIQAKVEEESSQYQVQLYVRGSGVRDYTCSCKAGNSYKGMCPHAALVWEEYQKNQEKQGVGRKEGIQAVVYTSPEVRTMIREYTNREVAQIQLEGQEARISLIPFLRIAASGQEVTVSFRLHKERTIALKDLVSFAQAMNTGAYVEYGKNFAFHHSLDAFIPESRPLAAFVAELANTYREYYSQFRKSSFETQPPLRELGLNREMRDRFFSIMENQSVETQVGSGGKRTLFVCRKNPQFHVQLWKQGKDGLKVLMEGNPVAFFGERCLYLGDESRLYRCDEECSRTLGVFVEQMIRSIRQTVTVNEKDMPLFLERVLKKIEPYCIFGGETIDWERYRPEPLRAEFRFDSFQKGELEMEPVLSYGDYSFHPVEDETLPRTVCRDVPGEFRISQLIAKYFQYKEPEEKKLVIRNDDERLFQLLEYGIQEFSSLGSVMVSDSVRRWRILPPLKVKANVTMESHWLDIQIDMEGLTGSDFTKILEAYRQKKRFYRLKSGEFLKLADDGLLAVARLSDGLSLPGGSLLEKGVRLPGYRALYLDSLLKEGPGITFYRDQLFKAVVRGMKSVEDSDFTVPPSLMGVLRGYQKLGYRWLRTLDAYGFGGILADDMGLGKTLQVIALLADEYGGEEGAAQGKLRTLIVCPASLVYNWENEFRKFAPLLRVLAVAGSAAERENVFALLKEEELRGQEGAQILITSYELLKRDISHYAEMCFRFQIVDEAQFIKNASTQSAKAVKAIQAKTRFALTGTPIENRLGELWSIFDYLMPGFLFLYPRFKKSYEQPIVKERDEESLRNLQRLVGPFILRRVKKDVLKELPDKLETCIYSRFEGRQRELYMANALKLKEQLEHLEDKDFHNESFQILSALTRLRQICCDPSLCYENYKGSSAKVETCIDLVRNGVQGGHKILLFSQFTTMFPILESRLREEEIAFYTLTGSTPKEERLKMAEAFQTDQVPIFLISLKAGGTGLNLTAADMVIHFDPWWNEAAQNQAADRAHRIGQEKQVTVYKLITKGTIEENIVKLQETKRDLAEQIIGEGAHTFHALDREEIIRMLEMGLEL